VIHRVRELRPDVPSSRGRATGRYRKALRRRRRRGGAGGARIQRDAGHARAGAIGHPDAQGDQAPARNARAALRVLRGFFHGATDAGAASGRCRPAAPACGDPDARRLGHRPACGRDRPRPVRRRHDGDPAPHPARTQATKSHCPADPPRSCAAARPAAGAGSRNAVSDPGTGWRGRPPAVHDRGVGG
jgi:hypothetical protein